MRITWYFLGLHRGGQLLGGRRLSQPRQQLCSSPWPLQFTTCFISFEKSLVDNLRKRGVDPAVGVHHVRRHSISNNAVNWVAWVQKRLCVSQIGFSTAVKYQYQNLAVTDPCIALQWPEWRRSTGWWRLPEQHLIFSSEGALYVILPYDYPPATFWTHTGP